MKAQKVIIIVGPTSSGKSALAVELARKFGGEVISADSRQVYRGLNICTGKISKKQMRGVRHHLLDVAAPQKNFSAHDFILHGERVIADIEARGKIPIVCGGTGFYIDALVGRITLPDVTAHHALRARLEKKTAGELFALLQKKSSARAKTIDRHNKRRLVRALEVADSRRQGDASTASRLRLDGELWLGIRLAPKVLRARIRARLAARMRRGMLAEVRTLHKNGLSWKRMYDLGLEYRYISRFLRGTLTKHEMLTELETKIWHYARRQRTYWRQNTDIVWLEGPDKKRANSLVEKFLAT